jgi:Flp pilus assembly protein TadG
MLRKSSQRGTAMLEFALIGIPTLVLILSTAELCFDMWNYHMLDYAVHEATRYVSVHGRGCVTGVTSCSVSVSNITGNIQANTIGVDPSTLSVTLTTDSGAVTNCSPVTSCASNATKWPPSSNLDNATGKRIIITARHSLPRILMLMPGAYALGSALNLPASSTGTISF